MKTKSILFLLLFIANVFSQEYTKFYNYNDKISIDRIRKNCAKGVYRVLVYQPALETFDFTSILLITKGNIVSYWKIRNDTILKTGRITNDSIFLYMNYLQTGVRKTEDKLKFIPPLIYCNVIIYIDRKKCFYFEENDIPGTYSPNNKYQKYRIEWVEIIKSELDSIM